MARRNKQTNKKTGALYVCVVCVCVRARVWKRVKWIDNKKIIIKNVSVYFFSLSFKTLPKTEHTNRDSILFSFLLD